MLLRLNKDKKIIFHKSDIGFVRSKNEDYSWSGTNSMLDSLLIVADGVGSYMGSDKASQIVSKVFIKSFLSNEYIGIPIKKWFERNVKRVKLIMTEHIKNNPFDSNMSTTLVLSIIIKKTVHIFWIGDSRAYIINKKNVEQITEDHNLLNHLINLDMEEEQITKYGKYLSSITNSICAGLSDEQKYDYISLPVKKNSFVFLASDGFYNFYDLKSLYSLISDEYNKEIISNELVNAAITNGSNDNISFSYFGLIKN